MNQQIENIIKKNLPEKQLPIRGDAFHDQHCNVKGFNECLDEINTSLIADEVLKVVVIGEIMRFMEEIQERANHLTPNLLLNEVVNYAYDRKDELLSNLSTKENKNNENTKI